MGIRMASVGEGAISPKRKDQKVLH
jgi:hypothetical protein